ncbi:hypothetical protein JW998_11445 [candidate division KSB1 bacterium]|nr:hypothetical protein [candidate division KSB1 bacterium]
MLPLLLKNVFRTLFANFRGKLVKKKRALLTLLGLAFFPFLIMSQTVDLFSVWMHIPTMGATFVVRFVATSFFAVLVLLCLTSLPSVMHHFFLAPDLSLLRALPINKRTIFLAKFVQVTLGTVGMYVAVGLPLLVSMCLALGAAPSIFAIMLIASLLFIFIPTGLSAIVAFALARLFSVVKMRRLATLILGLFIVVTWAGLQLVRLSRLNPASPDFQPQAVRDFAAWSAPGPLPSDWLVNSLYAATLAQWQTVGLNLAALLLSAAALACLAIVWRVRLDHKDIRMDAGRISKTARDIGTRSFLRPALAMLRKDMQVTRRDSRLLHSSLLLGAMLLVSPFVTSADVGNPGTVGLFMSYMPLTILTLIASSTLARQGLPLERLSLQYVLQAPVSLTSVLMTKIVRALLLIAPFTIVACLITAYKTGTAVPGAALAIAEHLSFVLCGAVTGSVVAVFTTNYAWSDPRYMTNALGAYSSTFIVLAVGAIGMSIIMAGELLGQQMVAFLLFFIYVFLVFWIGLRVSLARFRKLQWT